MKTSDALHRLLTLQDRIVLCIGQSCELVRTQGAGGRPILARRRWEMMRLLREYQLFKHIEVFDPAIMTGTRIQADMARRMKDRCNAAGDDFKRYVTCWSAEAIALSWTGYEVAMLDMSSRLLAHIDRERREVQHLLDGVVSTRRLSAG